MEPPELDAEEGLSCEDELDRVTTRLVWFAGTTVVLLPVLVYLTECLFAILGLQPPDAGKLYFTGVVGTLSIIMFAFPGVRDLLRLPKK